MLVCTKCKLLCLKRDRHSRLYAHFACEEKKNCVFYVILCCCCRCRCIALSRSHNPSRVSCAFRVIIIVLFRISLFATTGLWDLSFKIGDFLYAELQHLLSFALINRADLSQDMHIRLTFSIPIPFVRVQMQWHFIYTCLCMNNVQRRNNTAQLYNHNHIGWKRRFGEH